MLGRTDPEVRGPGVSHPLCQEPWECVLPANHPPGRERRLGLGSFHQKQSNMEVNVSTHKYGVNIQAWGPSGPVFFSKMLRSGRISAFGMFASI